MRYLWAAIVALHILNIPAVWLRYSPDISPLMSLYVAFFGVSGEGKIPTWFSAIALTVCAILLAIISGCSFRKRDKYALYWVGLTLTFALMSIDEAIAIHELTTAPLRSMLNTSGVFYFAWLIPAVTFVGVFGLLYVRFLNYLPRRSCRLFLGAGAVYLAGVIGMEMIGSAYVSNYGYDLTYGILASIEEILEMSGIALFIFALLDYLEKEVTVVSFRLES